FEALEAAALVGAKGQPDGLDGVVDEAGVGLLEDPQEGAADRVGDERTVLLHELAPGVPIPSAAALDQGQFFGVSGHGPSIADRGRRPTFTPPRAPPGGSAAASFRSRPAARDRPGPARRGG